VLTAITTLLLAIGALPAIAATVTAGRGFVQAPGLPGSPEW
jgi:hypothetical protein